MSVLALFDSLGIVSSITVAIKALLHELCTQKVGWNDDINESQRERWDTWVLRLKSLAFRGICIAIFKRKVFASYLNGFCDASATWHIVQLSTYESKIGTYVNLLTSKTRVAPLKPLTIPRLELMSAEVLTNLVSRVRKAPEVQVEIKEIRYSSDSKSLMLD